LIPY